MSKNSELTPKQEHFREAARKLAREEDEIIGLAHKYRWIEPQPELPPGYIVRVWGPSLQGLGTVKIDSFIENIAGGDSNILSTFFRYGRIYLWASKFNSKLNTSVELSVDPSTHSTPEKQLQEVEDWHTKGQMHGSRTYYYFDHEGNFAKVSGGVPMKMEPGDFEMAGSILYGMKLKLMTAFEDNTK